MSKKQRIRAKRLEQFLKPAGTYSYGGDFVLGLMLSARLPLLKASEERTLQDGRNFLTLYGPSAIVLAVSAFESFLNEVLERCLRTAPERHYEELAKDDCFMTKFSRIPALVTGQTKLANSDLELVYQIRNEIVHYYPRHVGTHTNVPEWLQPLIEKDVLYTIASGDIGWQQKLQSFELARWCCATIASAAEEFSQAICEKEQGPAKLELVRLIVGLGAPNFRLLVV